MELLMLYLVINLTLADQSKCSCRYLVNFSEKSLGPHIFEPYFYVFKPCSHVIKPHFYIYKPHIYEYHFSGSISSEHCFYLFKLHFLESHFFKTYPIDMLHFFNYNLIPLNLHLQNIYLVLPY